jgi:hypothetical protein
VRTTEVFIAAVLGLGAALAGAADPVALELSVGSDPVRVGDRVPVRVAARGGEELLWGGLEVAAPPDGPWVVFDGPREIPGTRPPVWEVVLIPLEVGELALPSLTATVRNAEGVGSEVTADETPKVQVATVLPEGDEVEPVPLRDPVGASGFPWEWVLPLAVPVLAAVACLAWWHRRRKSVGGPGAVPRLKPLAEFEALLDRLGARVGREPSEGVCDRLAAGMRRYLERQSGQPAEDMTSFELRLMARRLGWSEGVQRSLQEIMGVADSVRFGRLPVDEAGLRRVLDLALNLARDLDRQLILEAEAAAEAESDAGAEKAAGAAG